MSLIFTQKEDEIIEALECQIDLALRMNQFELAESIKEDISEITEAAIVRAQTCLNGFMLARRGNLPAMLTEQAV